MTSDLELVEQLVAHLRDGLPLHEFGPAIDPALEREGLALAGELAEVDAFGAAVPPGFDAVWRDVQALGGVGASGGGGASAAGGGGSPTGSPGGGAPAGSSGGGVPGGAPGGVGGSAAGPATGAGGGVGGGVTASTAGGAIGSATSVGGLTGLIGGITGMLGSLGTTTVAVLSATAAAAGVGAVIGLSSVATPAPPDPPATVSERSGDADGGPVTSRGDTSPSPEPPDSVGRGDDRSAGPASPGDENSSPPIAERPSEQTPRVPDTTGQIGEAPPPTGGAAVRADRPSDPPDPTEPGSEDAVGAVPPGTDPPDPPEEPEVPDPGSDGSEPGDADEPGDVDAPDGPRQPDDGEGEAPGDEGGGDDGGGGAPGSGGGAEPPVAPDPDDDPDDGDGPSDDPGDPQQGPADPDDPDDPDGPADPDEPVDPDGPDDPADPDDPDGPVDPDEPGGPEPLPPVAGDGSVATVSGQTVDIDGLALVERGDDSVDTSTLTVVAQPRHGSLTAGAEGRLAYTPSAAWIGDDEFVYEICDVRGACDRGRITVTTGREVVEVEASLDRLGAIVDYVAFTYPTWLVVDTMAVIDAAGGEVIGGDDRVAGLICHALGGDVCWLPPRDGAAPLAFVLEVITTEGVVVELRVAVGE